MKHLVPSLEITRLSRAISWVLVCAVRARVLVQALPSALDLGRADASEVSEQLTERELLRGVSVVRAHRHEDDGAR
eukprot:2445144-Rhodomonas_salina.1